MKGVIDSFQFLEENGFRIAKWKILDDEKGLSEFSFPFYLKADIADHKTEKKAVLKCNNFNDAKENFKLLRENFSEKIIVMEAIDGQEMIVGIKPDAVFEKLLLIGFGGINVSVLKDVQFRAIPVTKDEIEEAVRDLKFYKALVGRKKYAVDKFIDLAFEVSKLDVLELDLNPVILTEDDVFIVDARVEN